MKFKSVVQKALPNLPYEQTDYLIGDRLSFMRFLDLELEDPVPDATTIWLFREALAEAGLIDRLFARIPFADQLVRLVHADMVLVAIEASRCSSSSSARPCPSGHSWR